MLKYFSMFFFKLCGAEFSSLTSFNYLVEIFLSITQFKLSFFICLLCLKILVARLDSISEDGRWIDWIIFIPRGILSVAKFSAKELVKMRFVVVWSSS